MELGVFVWFPDVPALVNTRTFELWAENRKYPEMIPAKPRMQNWTRKTFLIQQRSHKMILLKKTLSMLQKKLRSQQERKKGDENNSSRKKNEGFTR